MISSQRIMKGLYLYQVDGLEILVENLGYRTKQPQWIYRTAWTKSQRTSRVYARKKHAVAALTARRNSPDWANRIGECLRKQQEYINGMAPADRDQLSEFYGHGSAALNKAKTQV